MTRISDSRRVMVFDIETYSDLDLTKVGVYRYSEDPSFEIICLSYCIIPGPVKVVSLLTGEELPQEFLDALLDPHTIKRAYNAAFERVCTTRLLAKENGTSIMDFLPPEQWQCSMVAAAYNGYPMSLKEVGAHMNLDKQKLEEGKELISYFCKPCKPTKANGGRTRNLPEHAPEKWAKFLEYNIRDVVTEMEIDSKLPHEIPQSLWDDYYLDQRINDRGILVDRHLAENALRFAKLAEEEAHNKMRDISGVENPNSAVQLKQWLADMGVKTDSLGKEQVKELIGSTDGAVADVLQLRQDSAKSSNAKYSVMIRAASVYDDRIRGSIQYYGASRSGRFSGKLIQLQNLPKNFMEDLDACRESLCNGDYEEFRDFYSPVPQNLSELIRTAFIPRAGMKFVVADFSAIEARVLSYLCDCSWRIEAFANGEDIYCASASQMFKVPVIKHGENGHLRAKGKICELALGYGGGKNSLVAFGADKMGMTDTEMETLVKTWRKSNHEIVDFWWDVDTAVQNAVNCWSFDRIGNIRFRKEAGALEITLPSGRCLYYDGIQTEEGKFNRPVVSYYGTNQKNHKWTRIQSYGPKFVENITQAISRDILCNSIRNLKNENIVAHVHDELIIEVPKEITVEEVCERMQQTPSWAPGLLLRADGYETDYYKKD